MAAAAMCTLRHTDTQAHTQITHRIIHKEHPTPHPMQTSGDPQAHIPPNLFRLWVRLQSNAQDGGWAEKGEVKQDHQ